MLLLFFCHILQSLNLKKTKKISFVIAANRALNNTDTSDDASPLYSHREIPCWVHLGSPWSGAMCPLTVFSGCGLTSRRLLNTWPVVQRMTRSEGVHSWGQLIFQIPWALISRCLGWMVSFLSLKDVFLSFPFTVSPLSFPHTFLINLIRLLQEKLCKPQSGSLNLFPHSMDWG